MINKLIIVFISIFMIFPYLSITSSAYGASDQDNGTTVTITSDSYSDEGVTFPFTFLGQSYNFSIPFSSDFMPVVRDIIYYFLLFKSIFVKFKAIPSLLSSVPFIGPSDQSPNESYKVYYNKSSGLFSVFKR